jgi:hypothetical protein
VLHRGPREALWNFDRPDVMIAAWDCPVDQVRHDGRDSQVVCDAAQLVAIVDVDGAPIDRWQPLVEELTAGAR